MTDTKKIISFHFPSSLLSLSPSFSPIFSPAPPSPASFSLSFCVPLEKWSICLFPASQRSEKVPWGWPQRGGEKCHSTSCTPHSLLHRWIRTVQHHLTSSWDPKSHLPTSSWPPYLKTTWIFRNCSHSSLSLHWATCWRQRDEICHQVWMEQSGGSFLFFFFLAGEIYGWEMFWSLETPSLPMTFFMFCSREAEPP